MIFQMMFFIIPPALLAGAFAAGPISGGAFNPAVGIGPTLCHAVIGEGTLTNLWIYFAGPLTGRPSP